MLNKVILIGRTTREPEIRKTASGTSIANFTLAVDNKRATKDGNSTADFIDCIAWDKTADIMEKYVSKGRLLAVEGRLQTRNYEHKDGYKVYVTEVVCDSVTMLDFKEKTELSKVNPSQKADEKIDISMDDLPF